MSAVSAPAGAAGATGARMHVGRDTTLRCMDADEFLAELVPESVDAIVTDPAYESLEKHRAVGTTTRLTKQWFSIYPNDRYAAFFQACYRALKKNTHLYVFADQESMFVMKPASEAAGFKFWKPIVWDKVHMGMGYHYRCRYEFVLFFEKGKRKLADLGMPDILSFPRVRSGYPTEKPVGLIRKLLEQSTSRGDLVVDPFFGSGATAVACEQLVRKFHGSDLSPEAMAYASKRFRGSIAE